MQGDALSLGSQLAGDAVYADPPYEGQHKRYNCEPVDYQALISVMEQIAPVRALSCSVPMLRSLLTLVPVKSRVAVWMKPWAFFKPGVWPGYSWEPVIIWGKITADRSAPTPRDWLLWPMAVKPQSAHVTPKPPEFAEWVTEMILPKPAGKWFVDLYCGSGVVGSVAEQRGCQVFCVDTAEAHL